MGFNPCNHSLKIWESIRTPTPKVGAHLGVWRFIPSHSPTLPGAWNVIPRLHSWPTSSQALALVTSLRLGLWHIISLWSTHPTNTYKWIGHTYCIIHIHVVHMFKMLHWVHMIHTFHMFQLVHIVHILHIMHMDMLCIWCVWCICYVWMHMIHTLHIF